MKQRELLLVPFPFSDQSGRKIRPVIIVSNDNFNEYSQDIIVVGVTSNVQIDAINLTNNDLEEGKLFTECSIKSENILKIDKELIIKKIGKIKKEKLRSIINRINDIIKEK